MSKLKNDNLIKIIIDVQNNVEGAFEQLYNETINFSYSIASLLLKNKEDIEDALQNSYMYVAKSIQNLRNLDSFESWLSVIVKHECQKYIAKHKRVTDIFSSVLKSKDFELTYEESLDFELIERKEISNAVQEIVNKLPDDKRACIVLYYFEQNSLSEIAEILGIPEGTVKSRLYNARKTLEKEFKKLQKNNDLLFGISAIPLVVLLFTYQSKNAVVPVAIEKAVLSTVAANGTVAAIGTASATAATGSTVTATAGTSAAAGTATAAVSTKIAAVAVAATIATGGTVATVKTIKEHRAPETTTVTVSETFFEKFTTAVSLAIEETTTISDESSTTATTTKRITSISNTSKLTTSESSATETTVKKTKPTTTRRDYSLNKTTKPVTTTQPTTKNTTTTLLSATADTTTQPETSHSTSTATTKKPIETTEKITETTTEEQATTSPDFYNVSSGVLYEYTGNKSDVAIPSKVGSDEVTAIGAGAFAGNSDITSVYVPSSVTKIGQEAFSDCTNLVNISLPSSLQSIGIGAFYGCTSLTSVSIPSGVTTIGDDAFADCKSLTSISIPLSVTSIGDNAFGGCDNLVIKCPEGSVAHNYAVENSMNFELI